MMFPKTLKVTTQLSKHGENKILGDLVSEHYGDLSLRLQITFFQPTSTNEVSKSKLKLFLLTLPVGRESWDYPQRSFLA